MESRNDKEKIANSAISKAIERFGTFASDGSKIIILLTLQQIRILILMKFPWRRGEECKHLVKYQGTSIDIAGITVPNIFSLGSVSIKPQVLEAADKAIQWLDMNYFQNCETLKQAPNEESKTKYFDLMTKQQLKLNDIAMAIAAYSTNLNSQKLEETLSNILESNLELSDSEKNDIKTIVEVNTSMKDIETDEDVEGAKVEEIRQGKLESSMEKIKTKGKVKGPEIGKIGD